MGFLSTWWETIRTGLTRSFDDYRNEMANGSRVAGAILAILTLRLFVWVSPIGEVLACLGIYLLIGIATFLVQRLASPRFYERWLYVQVSADVLMFTAGIHYSGSATTVLTMLYPVLVMIAAFGWGRGISRWAAQLVSVAYGVLLYLEANGTIPYDPFFRGEGHLDLWFRHHAVWERFPRWQFFVAIYSTVVLITGIVYWLANYLRDQLAQTQDAMARQKSLVAVGELVAGAAHELNNPLGSAGSLLETLIEEIQAAPQEKLPEELRGEFLETAGRATGSVRRAHGVVRQLLDLSRHALVDMEEVSLERILRNVVDTLRVQYPDKAPCIETRFREGFPPVRANAMQLSQVVTNIAENAMHVIKPGEGRIELSLATYPKGVIVRCTDNGPGMTKEVLDKIFLPFFTTKGKDKGTGMGLFLSQEIMRRLGGEIRVTSELGRGTTFEVRVPSGR